MGNSNAQLNVINSKEYWDHRFGTDWIECLGDKQTIFFATVLCTNIPDSLVKEIMANEYTVCDMGCAQGDGVPVFSRRLGINMEGMDFSAEAIRLASEKYPQNKFWVGDLQNIDIKQKYDVTLCSNVLEHFCNPWEIFENLAKVTNKYIIIMVPYREQLEIEEHLYHFSEDVVPMQLAGFALDYVNVIDCREIPDNLYPDRQLLLIYRNGKDHNTHMLSAFTNSIAISVEKEAEKEAEKVVSKLNAILDEKEQAIQNAKATCYKINSSVFYKIMCVLGRFVNQFLKGNGEEKKKFLSICKNCITGKGSEFTRNDGYNMILNVCNVLDESAEFLSGVGLEEGKRSGTVVLPQNINPVTQKCLEQEYSKPDILIFSVIDYDFRHQRPQHFASRFAENGHRVFYVNANFTNKESVKKLTDNLHVVDWKNKKCNAVYYLSDWKLHEKWFKEKADNLIYQYAIKDAIIILDYPNWVYGAEYLRKLFGFRIVVDYMDDFTGFLGTTTNVLKDNCIHMLKTSDQVIASSQFLSEIAQNYTAKLNIVRNGTEVKHFYQALEAETHKKRPVIGYYGAVSHWFDWEKVCYVAENMPDCDMVIIGEVTEHKDKLEKYSNIKLLGERNYEELPDHLSYFDVCLIPFDTSTDLIKATNPVKFYEYLSAGKRIVATEIPELEPFRNQYVYMSNDNETFLKYVKLCLDAKDELKSKEECVAFAKENDWQLRYEAFADVCLSTAPKVSIIVLTYNNLELSKACVKSILSKTAYPNYELIILDNMSTDGTVEYLRELDRLEDPRIKIIFNDRNSGFAGGNNKAITEATGEYIMLLNNDTVVTRGWLTNAVKHLVNDEKCGMCGAVTNSIGNQAKIRVKYKNKKELDNFAYLYTSLHNNEIYTDVDRLAMFCTIIRKDIMDQYGILDENYEIGMFEDDDYAKVVEKAGYTFYIAEDVFVHHVDNASFKKLDAKEYKEIFRKNKAYYEKKWNTKWEMPKYRDGVTEDVNRDIKV